jgi:hypothetical protein
MPKNIFVVGFDDFNNTKLKAIGQAKSYTFHPLLEVGEVKTREPFSVEKLIRKAETKLEAFSGTIDAIVGYWDFPVTCLAPFLSHRYHLPAPSLESVLKSAHKYWSRIEQSKVITDHPAFCAFNPFEKDALSGIHLKYPFWIKPIKSYASQLGFKIHDEKEFHECVAIIRDGILRFGIPFNYFLRQVHLPPEVANVHGTFCIAEQIISGKQCTLEGYVHKGHCEVYGVIDSIREPKRSTFARYQFPSRLPKVVQKRMVAIAEKVLTQIQFDNSPFNIEFFYDEHADRIWLLEINPRISQSHCDLFEKVDGASHHEVMIDIALGKKPAFPRRKGMFNCAAKFFLRTHEDAVVKRIPSKDEIRRVKELFPETLIQIHVKEGMRPSELLNQESYSYELGFMFMGAHDQQELLDNHRKCLEHLNFKFS